MPRRIFPFPGHLISMTAPDHGGSESLRDRINWDATPVQLALDKMMEFKPLERPKWAKEETAKIAESVDGHFRGGKPTTENWFDSAELFDAAYILAGRFSADSEDARKYSDLALHAARLSVEQDRETVSMAFGFPKINESPTREYVCGELLKIFRDDLKTAPHPAIPLFNIYCVYQNLGDADLAHESLEKAHDLCPLDSMIAPYMIRYLEGIGDFDRADKIHDEVFGRRPTEETLGLSHDASEAERSAERFRRERKPEQALEALGRAWAIFEKIEEMRRNGRVIIPPTIGLSRNRVATLIGLIHSEMGNLEQAIKWLTTISSGATAIKLHWPRNSSMSHPQGTRSFATSRPRSYTVPVIGKRERRNCFGRLRVEG
ncbi:MAG: tetratricopeptide repeat protein [Candidatus Coatesbacteria bacterium]|nr:tetratricopeptide repeat protein [Candidatus Coatesbacteria bacterium]